MNTRTAFLGLALLASGLAAGIALELDHVGQPAEDTGRVRAHPVSKLQPRVASEDPEDHTDAWVATALARPLFSRDRRPTPGEVKAAGGVVLAALPRLTGVMIGPFGRTAIFAGTGGGKPVAVSEGKTLGAYTIQAIEPGGVTVAGPQGVQHVALTADATTRHELAAEIPQPQQIPGIPGIPGLPGYPRALPPGVVAPGAVPGLPRPNFLNLRNGLQFQRGLSANRTVRPNQEGSD